MTTFKISKRRNGFAKKINNKANLMKSITVMVFLLFSVVSLYGKTGSELAKDLSIAAGSKAIQQWERVFEKERIMKKLGIDKLNGEDQAKLKEYLISHAADSDSPAAAGL
jgi:hypothetical protein